MEKSEESSSSKENSNSLRQSTDSGYTVVDNDFKDDGRSSNQNSFGKGDKKDTNAFCFSLDKNKIYNYKKGKNISMI